MCNFIYKFNKYGLIKGILINYLVYCFDVIY